MTAQSKSFLENTVFAHTLESTPPVKILLFHHPCRRLAARNPPYRGSTGVSRGDGWKASEPVPKPWFSAGFLRQNSGGATPRVWCVAAGLGGQCVKQGRVRSQHQSAKEETGEAWRRISEADKRDVRSENPSNMPPKVRKGREKPLSFSKLS